MILVYGHQLALERLTIIVAHVEESEQVPTPREKKQMEVGIRKVNGLLS